MELTERYNLSLKVSYTLKEVLSCEYSVIVRDPSIQRFKYIFESFWKVIKQYLADVEGIICYSPKSCLERFLA